MLRIILYILMSKTLVIVESPGKIKKISSYLGNDYIVKASFGHCRDLDKTTLSIEIENNFNPLYIVIPEKRKVISELKKEAKMCKEVILASDEDREGEMIAASLRDMLSLKEPKRIVFHEITKKAINNAIKKPTIINDNMVMAQQTRRLLDRLVGYKLSPLLWKKVQGKSSAGRVQSVVIKIIIDKENEINNCIMNPYFKTIGVFKHKGKKLNTVLTKEKEPFCFEDETNIRNFLNQLNSKSIVKVTNIDEKEILRKPQAPFTTSTLQQDAYTKCGFTANKTMSIAQQLYEAGKITYMRTDSTILSNDAIDSCKKYIVTNYGDFYYMKRTFSNKNKSAQEAHEAIRPTSINTVEYKDLGPDCAKLYDIIWKRTVASQMADAKIKSLYIYIDIINNKTILPDNTFFTTTFEEIIFDGYLLIYNDYENEETNKCKININDTVDYEYIKVQQDYNKPPLRYNEPGLIKYLEKNGIGRPSTYASIMSKIIDKNYIVSKNIEGVVKESKQFTVPKTNLHKNTKINSETVNITIGSEKNKLVPTETAIMINDFLCENFKEIMDIEFTAKMEKLLDKIANGKAIWYNVLRAYYDMFNPIVEKLAFDMKEINKTTSTDKFIGYHPVSNLEIFSMIGRYGLCVKIKDNDKWRYAPIKDMVQDNITLDIAVEALKYPMMIGKIDKTPVYLNKGQHGLYFKVGDTFLNIKDDTKKESIEYAIELLEIKKLTNSIKTFTIKNKTYNLKLGPFGYYFQVTTKGKKKSENIALGKDIDVDTINEEYLLKLLQK